MRIAHFCQRYPPAPGGSEAYFARLSEYLSKQGHEVHVFTSNADDLEAFWDSKARRLPEGDSIINGVTVHRHALRHYPAHRTILKLLSLWPSHRWRLRYAAHNPILPSMWRWAHETSQKFDVVHATAFPYGWPLICALELAHRLNVPFFLTPFVHTGDPEDPHDRMRRSYTKPALISLAQAASRVFVQTEVEQETLLDVGVTAEKLTIQGMGVDVESCTGGSRKNARKEWGIENHEIVIGHLANKSWEKGTIDLLRASQMAWQSGADFRLVLAGPEMRNFREFWATFEPKEKITLRGWLTENQKRDFFAGIDIFAMPSRSDSFGIVFLEAWMNRLPNLAYRAGGVASVIRHQVDGLLVRCGDLEGLARSIHHLVEDAPLRERLGQAGYAKTVTDFHWEDKLRLIEECYHETI